jgi:hypothetical protein
VADRAECSKSSRACKTRSAAPSAASASSGEGKLDPIPYRSADEPLRNGDPNVHGGYGAGVDGEWDRDRYIVIEHDEPLPFTLTALVVGQRVSG